MLKIFRIIFSLIVLSLGLIISACSNSAEQTIQPTIGTLESSFTEMAKTRLSTTYVLTMPLSGELDTIALQEGDPVIKDQVVANLKQYPLTLTVEEAQSKLDSIIKYLTAEKAHKGSLTAEEIYSDKMLKRNITLGKQSFVAQSDVDAALMNEHKSTAAIYQQNYNLAAIEAMQAQTETQLKKAQYDLSISQLRSPIDGVVLNRFTQGGQWLNSGTKLLEIGNLKNLEVISEVLTTNAQTLKVGDPVFLGSDGEHYPFTAKVTRIEPAAFTKQSALGIDEQRVNIIIQPDHPEELNLGAGYRLFAKFITGHTDHAFIIPRSAVLQEANGQYYVVTKHFGKLKKQPIIIAVMTDTEVAVSNGIKAHD